MVLSLKILRKQKIETLPKLRVFQCILIFFTLILNVYIISFNFCHFFIESDPNRLPTPCEKQREAALQGSADAFAPYCRRDGSFDPIQCKGLMCYCVDNNGKSIKGTDTPRPYQPNCYGT